MIMGRLLLRGMLVGVLAGLVAFGVARVFGEPSVDRAIAFEDSAETGHHHDMAGDVAGHDHQGAQAAPAEAEPELVSRPVQSGLGLLTGTVLFGAALGGLFAIAFAVLHGRLGAMSPRATAALTAAGGYATLVVVPSLKYPANPPAASLGETIGIRTELFFVLLLASVVVAGLSLGLWRRLCAQMQPWNAALVSAAAYAVVMGAAFLILPRIDEVPPNFPADVLWQFRLASLGIQAALWTVLGIGFGIVAERTLAQPRPASQANSRVSWGR